MVAHGSSRWEKQEDYWDIFFSHHSQFDCFFFYLEQSIYCSLYIFPITFYINHYFCVLFFFLIFAWIIIIIHTLINCYYYFCYDNNSHEVITITVKVYARVSLNINHFCFLFTSFTVLLLHFSERCFSVKVIIMKKKKKKELIFIEEHYVLAFWFYSGDQHVISNDLTNWDFIKECLLFDYFFLIIISFVC